MGLNLRWPKPYDYPIYHIFLKDAGGILQRAFGRGPSSSASMGEILWHIIQGCYITAMEYRELSTVEQMLLLLIAEVEKSSGYSINQRIKARGYRYWAGVGTTSIYAGLKKLEKEALAHSQEDTEKVGKGPRGRVFLITELGEKTLVHNLRRGLAETREHDPRFNLALCGMHLLPKDEILACLGARVEYLQAEFRYLESVMQRQKPQLPQGPELLFDRILNGIESEMAWVQKVLAALNLGEATER